MSEYPLPFNDLVDEKDTYMTDFVCVYVLNHFSMNFKRFTAANRFTSEEERLEARDCLVSDTNRNSFWLWNFDGISVSARSVFQDYVDSQRAEANQRRCGTSLALNGSGDSDTATAKPLRLSNELTKAKSQVAEYYKRKLLAAKEHHCKLVNAEQATSLPLPSATATEGVILIILDGRAVCIPSTDIIYLSDITDVISRSFLSPSTSNCQQEFDGKCEFFVPPGVKGVPLNQWSRYQESHWCMTRLHQRMGSGRCSFSTEAQRCFGAGFHLNSGGLR
jgi:hypothetical protein